MTREENIRAILDTCFSESKDEIKEVALKSIMSLSAEAKTKCIAQIKVDTEEIVRRIKEEYDITDGWIPCSERLPEEFSVLCCDTYGEMLIAHPFECNDSDIGFSAESDECYMYNCIAWMPLPKPYKGGDDE